MVVEIRIFTSAVIGESEQRKYTGERENVERARVHANGTSPDDFRFLVEWKRFGDFRGNVGETAWPKKNQARTCPERNEKRFLGVDDGSASKGRYYESYALPSELISSTVLRDGGIIQKGYK